MIDCQALQRDLTGFLGTKSWAGFAQDCGVDEAALMRLRAGGQITPDELLVVCLKAGLDPHRYWTEVPAWIQPRLQAAVERRMQRTRELQMLRPLQASGQASAPVRPRLRLLGPG
jgi:hypothetical protein